MKKMSRYSGTMDEAKHHKDVQHFAEACFGVENEKKKK